MPKLYIDTRDLAVAMLCELERRHVEPIPGAYAETRGGPVALYGSAGAATLCYALGQPLGDLKTRHEWGKIINSFQQADGTFIGSDCAPHALCVSTQAHNILGTSPLYPVSPLAPSNAEGLPSFLDALDWSTTHKDFWGLCAPLLASGKVSSQWQEELITNIVARIDPSAPLNTWCAADDPPWRVISCLYHILQTLDAAAIPYPHSALLLDRLLDLQWDKTAPSEQHTQCTDGDWAWLLVQLGRYHPERYSEVMHAIQSVSRRRLEDWHNNRMAILSLSTHHLHCYVWVTALFQSLIREDFLGPYIKDTLNEPLLLRLRSNQITTRR